MTDPIDGVGMRLDRAKTQLDDLQTQEKDFLGTDPYSSTTHYDAESGCYVFIAHVAREPDRALGLLAAEAIHNMHSALDNLIWAIAGPVRNRRRLQFPIYDDPLLFIAEAYPLLQRLPAKLFEALEWCQPYNRDNLTYPERLAALKLLSNSDKHRAPIACGAVAEMFAIAGYRGEVEPRSFPASLTDPYVGLYEGKEIGRACDLPPGLEDQLKPIIHFGIAFAAVDAERVYQLHALVKMHDLITKEVVPTIRQALE